jgi:hypothetical protein
MNNAGPIVASDGKAMRSQNQDRETVPVSSGEGSRRYRMHGGAHGSAAPKSDYRHGLYTAEAIAERKATRAWVRSVRSTTR